MTPTGPLMIFLEGTSLAVGERDLLRHPAVGGVIFFSRNYNNKEQLSDLVSEVNQASPGLVLAVDHEGGRVQRFKEGFTHLPPMRLFGRLFDRAPEQALRLIHAAGRLVSSELREAGMHTGFSPVLDLAGASEVIGDRALHTDSGVVVQLGRQFIEGLREGGLLPVGKHFPGHGTATGDTHNAVVRDNRPRAQIEAADLKVFHDLAADGTLPAVMAAHVIYPQVDALPVCLSRRWLTRILRDETGFEGIVFSDDLAMQGIRGVDDMPVRRVLEAGCDMVLICNDLQLRRRALDELSDEEISRYADALGKRRQHAERRLAQARAEKDRDADAIREQLNSLTQRFASN